MDNASKDVVKEALSADEIKKVPKGIANKINNYVDKIYGEYFAAKGVYEAGRAGTEQKIESLQNQLLTLKDQYALEKSNLEAASKNISQLESQVEQYRQDINKLNESRARAEHEAAEFRRQRDAAIDERDSVQAMLKRRSTEIERLQIDVTSLTEQLQSATAAKCVALAKSEEVESMKTNLEFRERRMEQERTLLNSQIQNLTEDLNKRVNELLHIRRENTTRLINLQTSLESKSEELKIAKETIKTLTESNGELTKKNETLVERLKEHREAESQYHDSFAQELQSQTKLAELYKGMSEDYVTQISQLTDAVADLQKLLSENSDQYGDLETRYKEMQLNNEEAINKKNEMIEILKKELEDANELLKTTREQKLESVIESLAPSAAATSKLIKSGMSLTQIYSQFVTVNEQLIVKDAEIKRLNSYIEAIVKEVDDKAPMLRKQRDDYESALENIGTLSKQNESLVLECSRLQEEYSEMQKSSTHLYRENERLSLQLKDLGRQVCYLLNEVEELKSASVTNKESNDASSEYHNSSDIISKRLVTFGNIEELQANNQKLLTLVRELSNKQEEAEAVTPAEVAELKTKLTEMRENQADLLQNQERQTKMLNALIRQRDSYKKMYQNAIKMPIDQDFDEMENNGEDIEMATDSSRKSTSKTPSSSFSKSSDDKFIKEIDELKKKLEDSEKMIKSLQQEHENYQKEKATNEAMVSEQLDSVRQENRSLIQNNCKLTSVIEYKDEQLKISKSNNDILKKQVSSLEKKADTYNNTIMKLEQSTKHLTDEVLNAQSKLSRAEVLLDNVRQENKLLKDSESRLLRERDSLQREAHGQSLLLNNLEAIKASFERSEAEGKIRLEQRLDETSRECSALRRRLQEEQDRFRELSGHLERQTQEAKKRMEEEKAEAEKLRKQLLDVRNELQEKSKLIDDLHKKMKHNIIHDGNPLHEQIRKLEKQVDESKLEINTLQQQLKSAKTQASQYCDVSENAEKELKELNDRFEQYRAETETKMQAQQKFEAELKNKIGYYEQELNKHSDGQRDTANDLRNQLIKTRDELFNTTEELNNLKIEIEASKIEIIRLNENIQETEDKYAREMVHHSSDIQALTSLKEEMSRMTKEHNELLQGKEEAIKALELSKESWRKQEEAITAEKKEIQARLESLETQNSILHGQLEALSTQMSITQAKQGLGDTGADTSLDSSLLNKSVGEDGGQSSDQLLQIIKFLRREKDILIAKFDILQAENVRVRSQLEITTKQLEEAKVSETNARTKSDADVVTIAKHNEVLRKVETLNAITDSNRILREERDTLLTKIKDLSERTSKLEEELAPLQEKNRELTMKMEAAQTDNVSLKAEATRWRQRANTLIERANKTTPEDWRRLQQERENLAKLLMTEKDNVKKATEAKVKAEQQVSVLQKQVQLQTEQLKKLNDELNILKQQNIKLTQEIEDKTNTNTKLTEENNKVYAEIANKSKEHKALMSKYVSVRALARKYKEQVEEESKAAQEPQPVPPETQEQYREEGRREINEKMVSLEKTHNEKLQELTVQVSSSQEEVAKLRKENEQLRVDASTKYERSQNVLRSAKTKIQNLNESNDSLSKELNDLRSRLENQDGSDARVNNLKTQVNRLEKEKNDSINEHKSEKERLLREIETLNQHVAQLQRQLGQSGSKPSTSSGPVEKPTSAPPTANIKPMAGQTPQSVSVAPRRTGETPFASIRPISMPQRSVATLFPTSVNASTSSTTAIAVPPQQQVVHTTGNNSIEALSSSPTSSHTDYMPATSSANSAVPAIRQIAVPPTQQSTVTIGVGSCEEPPSAAESTQDMESEIVSHGSSQQSAPQQTQQAVALVLPRVEQQSEHEAQNRTAIAQSEQSSNSEVVASSQSASSSNTVTTSQAGTKRERENEFDTSTSSVQDEQQGNIQPQSKRSRMEETITESGTEVEYQVPTSSQRDQEDDVICVDSDDEENVDDEDEEEVILDDGQYDVEEEEEEAGEDFENYGGAECQAMEQELPQETDNNEVEIIDENPAAPDGGIVQEGAGASSNNASENQNGAQSETISSATSETVNAPASSQSASRNLLQMMRITPISNMRPSMMIEESGDDGIVPSTPTLYVPRRTDSFGEAVSSPHVPSGGRFTFNDPPTGRITSNVEQGQAENIEESRMEQLEESGTGRSVPTTPLQVSPQGDAPSSENVANVSSENFSVGESSSNNQENSAPSNLPEITITLVNTETNSATQQSEQKNDESNLEMEPEEEMAPPQDDVGPSREAHAAENAEMEEGSDGVSSEGEKQPIAEIEEGREAEASQSPSSNTRGSRINVRSGYHRSCRSRGTPPRPIPIIWNDQQAREGATGTRQNPGNFARTQRGRRSVRRAQQNNYMRY